MRRFFCAPLLLALSCPLFAAPTARLANLSSRSIVGSGANSFIAGFVIDGTAPKNVLIRAIGPTLANFGVPNTLARPHIVLRDANDAVVQTADAWPATLAPVFAQLGASPLPDGSADAALEVALPPGAYSAVVSADDSGGGAAMLEVYEVDGTSRLVNLSTRAYVDGADGVLISGLVVSGGGARRLLIRASGPALATYGVPGVLADPFLTVLDVKGHVIATSDNWDEGGLAPEIAAVTKAAGAAPFPAGSKDAAVSIRLDAGVYSMHIHGVNGASGVTLLEVFDVTPPDGSATYGLAELSWDPAAIDGRLGPTFDVLSPGAIDDRPWLPGPTSKIPPAGYYVRINPYELGDAPGPDTNYWSDSGQVAYVPDDPANDPGLDRIQTFAYYNQVFALSPRLDWASGRPHPDPQTREASYAVLNGAPPTQPVAMVRNCAMQQNEALVLYRDGLLAVAGTQTSRAGSERPYPGLKFPADKVPRAIAVTTSNEFALVPVWDTVRHQGQLAVVALEGKYLPYHTWPYMGMPNQGSWSDFKLLGYVDLPMISPDSVAAASNGLWTGPSSTDNKVLSQIDLSDETQRRLVATGAWSQVVAKNGYAIVASSTENLVTIVDLTPLFSYMRDSYLKSLNDYTATLAARGDAPDAFPQTFAVRPQIAPKVIWTKSIDQPTAVLAGHKVDRWSIDSYKAYVASRSGTLHIVDASTVMARNSWEARGPLKEIGTAQVGRNPVALAFARYGEAGLPLIPNDPTGVQRAPDPLNNMLYAVCRGDREVDAVVTWQGAGQVYRRLRDLRLVDPVGIGIASRANIVSVADFRGRQVVSFRIGTINDTRNNRIYLPAGDGSLPYEFAGAMPVAGEPFLVGSSNVN